MSTHQDTRVADGWKTPDTNIPLPPLSLPVNSQEVLTHRIKVVKILMHPNDFVIQLIVAAGSGKKGVSVSDEHVEQVHNLYKEGKRSYNGNIYSKSILQQTNSNYIQNHQRNSS